MNDDGLLDPVAPAEDEWLRRDSDGDDRLRDAAEFVGDALSARHVVWPAAPNGRLTLPPDEHLLDALVRGSLDVGTSPEWDAEWDVRPRASTVFFRTELAQKCDICNGRPARYDGYLLRESPTLGSPDLKGHAANMCPWCYQRRSTLLLGLGEGQMAIRYSEVPAEVWRGFERAVLVWRERGAPVHQFDVEAHESTPSKAIGAPYEYPFDDRGSSLASRAFHRLLEEVEVRHDPARGLFPENISATEHGLVFSSGRHPVDGVTQRLILDTSAVESLDQLVGALTEKAGIRTRSLPHDLRLAAVRQVGRVLFEGLKPTKAIGQLESSLSEHLGPTIVVAPIGGLEWDGPPRLFGDHFLIGRLTVEFHRALDEMSARLGLATLHLEGGPSWAESYEHLLEDPESYVDLEQPFHPVVVAQAIDASASVAVELTLQKLRAFFGAVQAANSLEGRSVWSQASLEVSGEPPGDEDDYASGCTLITLERGARRDRDYGIRLVGGPVGLDSMMAEGSALIVEAVASWAPDDIDAESFGSRIAACAKQYQAANDAHDVDFTALHLAAAMEALLVRRMEEEKSSTLARRAGHLLAPTEASRSAVESEIRGLYDLRSDAAHLGLSTKALVDRSSVVAVFVEHVPELLAFAVEAMEGGASHHDWLSSIDESAT